MSLDVNSFHCRWDDGVLGGGIYHDENDKNKSRISFISPCIRRVEVVRSPPKVAIYSPKACKFSVKSPRHTTTVKSPATFILNDP